jgi:hypothetical protein
VLSGLDSQGNMASLSEDLLITVNKLQDLVFNTIGNDSLDLPQIVSSYGKHDNYLKGANILHYFFFADSSSRNFGSL